MSTQDHPNETVRIGQIVGAFGIRGQVKVDPLTDFLDRFDKGNKVLLKGTWVTIETSAIHKGRPLLKLAGIDTTNAAEALQWEYLDVEPQERPELDDDEFYTEDLIGLKVITTKGVELGVVDDVLDYPAQDVLKVGEILIPVVKEFVKDVNLDEERITVELIYGMLPGEE